jgi:hypothetical protein
MAIFQIEVHECRYFFKRYKPEADSVTHMPSNWNICKRTRAYAVVCPLGYSLIDIHSFFD